MAGLMMHALLAVALAALRAAPPVSAGGTLVTRVPAPVRMAAPVPKGATMATLSTLEKVPVPLSSHRARTHCARARGLIVDPARRSPPARLFAAAAAHHVGRVRPG